MFPGKVYYDPEHATVFGSLAKSVIASKNKKRDVKEWLSCQITYTLHKPLHKSIPRNSYTITNIDDVWKMDLAYF